MPTAWLLLACTTPETLDSGDSAAVTPLVDAFVDAVVDFQPGVGAGFGADDLPEIVLGPPLGGGPATGSLDVVSLGEEGVIVVEFLDNTALDGEGPDLIVFENAFPGWPETGIVGASQDGETWFEWPCDAANAPYTGCAGISATLSHPDNGIDPTDPEAAGGDAFDLAVLGLDSARFVRIRDSGENDYAGTAGGFDLDAVAAVHAQEIVR